MSELSVSQVLCKIQKELKAPKNQYNNFGKYNYRSCEDIVEAVKKILPNGCCLLLSDTIVNIGDSNYIKATATLMIHSKELTMDQIAVDGWARESITKKGMDDSQITGSASSYARKYALNGLFAIDDTKDAYTQDNKQESFITSAQVSQLEKLIDEVQADKIGFIKYLKVDSLKSLPVSKFNLAITALNKKKNDNT